MERRRHSMRDLISPMSTSRISLMHTPSQQHTLHFKKRHEDRSFSPPKKQHHKNNHKNRIINVAREEHVYGKRREFRAIVQDLKDFDASYHEGFLFQNFNELHVQFKSPFLETTDHRRRLSNGKKEKNVCSVKVENECLEEELNFTDDDLNVSVRTLVSRIKMDASKLLQANVQAPYTLLKKEDKKEILLLEEEKEIQARNTVSNCNELTTNVTRLVQEDGDILHVTSITPPSRFSKIRRFSGRFRIPTFLRRRKHSCIFTEDELESIEGARWKIIELAYRAGGKHRCYLIQAVNVFFPLTKFGRRGEPHKTRLHCTCLGTLQWQQKRGGMSTVFELASTVNIIEGRDTDVFKRHGKSKGRDDCSLSIVFKHRTLDLETQSQDHRDWLMSALRTLVSYYKRHQEVCNSDSGSTNSTFVQSKRSMDTLRAKFFGVPSVA